MICGIGIDLVENDRLARIIAKWGSKFLQRVFSDGEISYCEKHFQAEANYGARFAAKESFVKALGVGLGRGVKLTEIEVVNDIKGKPGLVLSGQAKAQLEKRKIVKVHLSLTHTKSYASAIVLLEK
ncbi:MAG: holo-[acyl-carrier-protein] synthase [Deltaproteobacteria bacterium HGW-Deltaproteobacteria-12]|jgi:holo-[acyl-carrier protein] synthase|nr:MAG: holo-[acyl-carrier-protein] synthase [Deltaproteobacteria bacterium HGW-Deltaproteobacteria-12]